jgi:hypothetical protein
MRNTPEKSFGSGNSQGIDPAFRFFDLKKFGKERKTSFASEHSVFALYEISSSTPHTGLPIPPRDLRKVTPSLI